MVYVPASAIAKPILLYDLNPVDYYVEHGPVGIAMVVTGFSLVAVGAFLKSINDESELQTICVNIRNKDNQEIVETGMYKHARHPCYFAQTLMATGFTMVSPAIDTIIAFIGYLGLTQHCAKVEEKKNLAQFGERYKEYMSKVPRWPRVSKISKLFS